MIIELYKKIYDKAIHLCRQLLYKFFWHCFNRYHLDVLKLVFMCKL